MANDGVLGELSGFFKAISAGSKSIKRNMFWKKGNSVKKMASRNILKFPLLISDNMEADNLEILMKSLEAEYSDYVQIVLSQDDLIEIGDNETKADLINRLGINSENIFEDGILDSIDPSQRLLFSITASSKSYRDPEKFINENWDIISDKISTTIKDCYNDSIINNLTISRKLVEAKGDSKMSNGSDFEGNRTDLLTDREVKKASKIQPTLLRVTAFYSKDGVMQSTEIVVGIKVFPHLVKSDDFVENIFKALREKNFRFSMIRWTTGEIKFWRDIVFQVSQSKESVYEGKKDRNARIWYNLKTLRLKNGIKKLLKRYPVLPTTTLCLTEREVDRLNRDFAVDITDSRTASKLVENLYLLSLVLVDQSTEEVLVWDDENKKFLDYSLRELESGGRGNDNSLKAVLKILSRN